jgi:hypothetical protein
MAAVKMSDPRTTRVADLQPGQYADGSALHDIQYLECTLILKTDKFTSPAGFRKYGKLVARATKDCGVGFDTSVARRRSGSLATTSAAASCCSAELSASSSPPSRRGATKVLA